MSETGERSARDLGKAHMQGGRFIQAAEALRTAVAKDPSDEMAWRLLGGALASMGENQESVDAFTEARNLAPNSAKSHFNLALALQAAGREDDARLSLEKSLEIDPAYLQARSKLNEMLGIENTEEVMHAPAGAPDAPVPEPTPPPLNTPPTPPDGPDTHAPSAGLSSGMSAVGGGMSAVGGGHTQQQATHTQQQTPPPTNQPEPPSAYAPLAPPPTYAPRTPPPPPGSYVPPPQAGQYGQPPGYGRGDHSAAPAVNGTLILILGIAGLLVCAPCGVAAWIMGNSAMATLDQYQNADQSQRGMANAGKILGIVGTGLWALGMIFWFIIMIIGAAAGPGK
jgi:tetratricopeptide (TPR) repeat protein